MRTITSSSTLGYFVELQVESLPRTGEELLFPGCCFCNPTERREISFLAEDQLFLVIHREVIAGVLAKQDSVATFDVGRNSLSFFDLSRPDGDHFAFLRLLFGRVRDDDAAFRDLLFFEPPDQNPVVQWCNLNCHLHILRSNRLKDFESYLLVAPYRVRALLLLL